MCILWLSSTEHIDTEVGAELAHDCGFDPEARHFSCKILLESQSREVKMTAYRSTNLGKLTHTLVLPSFSPISAEHEIQTLCLELSGTSQPAAEHPRHLDTEPYSGPKYFVL